MAWTQVRYHKRLTFTLAQALSTRLITNALVAKADEIVLGTVELHEGSFTDVQPGITSLAAAENWGGDYLIPGLVELHTDNLEKQLEPRPGVRWPALPALLIHDALISSSGITTVLDAMGVGDFDETSVRAQGLQAATQALHHARQQDLLRAEHLLHMRCEIACDNMLEVVTPFLDDPTVRLVRSWITRPDNANGWTCRASAFTPSATSAGATSISSKW